MTARQDGTGRGIGSWNRKFAIAALALIAAGVVACCAVTSFAAPRATVLSVSTLESKRVRIPDPGRKFTLLFFVGHDCPVSNAYTPEMNRIAAKYAPLGVVTYAVYPEKDLTVAAASAHAKEFGYAFPAVLDAAHVLVHAFGATVTPEAYLLTPEGKAIYHGRIDDRYIDFGKARYQASRHDLRDAIEAALHGKPIPASSMKAIGCYITD